MTIIKELEGDSVIFGNQSISTYTPRNIAIWLTLAFQAGLLNLGGMMACHSYVSHVTGYATLMGVEFGKGNFKRSVGLLTVPLFFLLGSLISGYLIDVQIRRNQKPLYHWVFGFLFLAMMTVVVVGFNGGFGRFGEPLLLTRDYFLLALLCLSCGLQNGMVTLVSRSVVRTTHLTGVTTDLGIGIARIVGYKINLMSLSKLNQSSLSSDAQLVEKLQQKKAALEAREDQNANWVRFGIIFCFALGSVVGYPAFRSGGFRGFLFPALVSAILFSVSLYFSFRPNQSEN